MPPQQLMLEVRDWRALPANPTAQEIEGSAPPLARAWRFSEPGTRIEFTVAFRGLEEGRWLAYCTTLGGALAEGASEADAVEALRGVLAEMLTQYREDCAPVPHMPMELEPGDRIGATIVLAA